MTEGQNAKTKGEKLLELADRESPELFHTETGEAFARVKVSGHFENLPLQGGEFSLWLKHLAWRATNGTVKSEALDDARGALAARAIFDGPERRMHNRVAWHDEAIWYDLADPHWRAIRIDPESWQIVTDVPILFRRYSHQRAQTLPDPGGKLSEAERFLNLRTETDSEGHAVYDEGGLFLVALISYLVPDIPHPVIVLHGEHGAAKTTLSRMARELTDPSETATLGEPKRDEIEQLFQHNYLLPFDNLSFLPNWLSDTLCRAITGDGLSKRGLYTDEQDVIFSFRRCVMLNGINEAASRPDLLDRSLLLECQPIPDGHRMPERVFWQRFGDAKARILGAMFNTLSRAMRVKDGLSLPSLPRMADFAEWGCAIAEAWGWGMKAFLGAYSIEAGGRNLVAVDSKPVAQTIISLMEHETVVEEPAASLLHALENEAVRVGIDTRGRDWPRQPHVLSRRVNEVVPNLRRLGIRVTHGWNGPQKVISIVRASAEPNSEGSEGSVGFDRNESAYESE